MGANAYHQQNNRYYAEMHSIEQNYSGTCGIVYLLSLSTCHVSPRRYLIKQALLFL